MEAGKIKDIAKSRLMVRSYVWIMDLEMGMVIEDVIMIILTSTKQRRD